MVSNKAAHHRATPMDISTSWNRGNDNNVSWCSGYLDYTDFVIVLFSSDIKVMPEFNIAMCVNVSSEAPC